MDADHTDLQRKQSACSMGRTVARAGKNFSLENISRRKVLLVEGLPTPAVRKLGSSPRFQMGAPHDDDPRKVPLQLPGFGLCERGPSRFSSQKERLCVSTAFKGQVTFHHVSLREIFSEERRSLEELRDPPLGGLVLRALKATRKQDAEWMLKLRMRL